MINNRQNGRRRGRGGQQARNGQPGGADRGNRIDNRARGNAAQLLEKYRNLARDAQMQGDRVNTEYYLQFADHYFRVLSENRARFEEQRPRQNDYRDDYAGDEDGGDAGQQRFQPRDDQGGEDGWDDGEQQQPQDRSSAQDSDYRRERQAYRGNDDGGDRAERQDRAERPDRAERGERADRGERMGREGNRERGRRNAAPANGNGYANGNGSGSGSGNGFAAPDFLSEPIAPRLDLGRADDEAETVPVAAEPAEEAAPKRRRTRRPRAEGESAEA